MNNRRAFTLIELLVVIAIIAILAAILFPVFAAAREKARATTCASNEKQIGMAVLQYVQDFDEIEPYQCNSGNLYSNATNLKWMDMIYPYIQGAGVFTCPSDMSPQAAYVYAGNIPSSTTTNYQVGSYTANVIYQSGASTSAPWSLWSVGVNSASSIASPSTTVLVGETTYVSSNSLPYYNPVSWRMYMSNATMTITGPGTNNFGGTTPQYRILFANTLAAWQAYTNNSGFLSERHNGTTNVLWCDDHVKAVKLDTLTTTGTGGVYTYWTTQADPY